MLRQVVRCAAGLALCAHLGGCAVMQPADFFRLSEESPANRAMQIRLFETGDDRELLSASAAVLQDLGFQVEEIGRDLGFLSAAKERSAREYGDDIGRFFLWVLSLGHLYAPVDLQQKISATLIVRPVNPGGTRHEVRIMFYRVVWKGEGYSGRDVIPPGIQRMEMIRSPEIYRQFFAKLSNAVFLEGFTL